MYTYLCVYIYIYIHVFVFVYIHIYITILVFVVIYLSLSLSRALSLSVYYYNTLELCVVGRAYEGQTDRQTRHSVLALPRSMRSARPCTLDIQFVYQRGLHQAIQFSWL